MGDGHHSAVAVKWLGGEHLVRPVSPQIDAAKRSGVAKAVRGSMMVTANPDSAAIGASAWLMWTAPTTRSWAVADAR